jgi:hypothetical protein
MTGRQSRSLNLDGLERKAVELLELADWQILFDREATLAAYERTSTGGPELCACNTCRNWADSREKPFPAEFRAFLARLGIPPNREAEVYHNGRLESGLHYYAGWYHFVGKVLCGENEGSPNIVIDPFAFFFHSSPVLTPEAFCGPSVVQLEFEAQVPWLSGTPEAA